MEDDSALEYIRAITKGVQRIEAKLKKHVTQMCNLVFKLPEAAYQDEATRNRLKDIYWSLKLHLLFHLGVEAATEHSELKALGSRLQLTEQELAHLPDETYAHDPGSIFLKIVSDQEESPDAPIGSEDHADKVLKRAKDDFNTHLTSSKNPFKPKVLAKVSRKGIWRVGSSLAVSNFLRPIYLHNRIFAFKENLLKAIISAGNDGVRDAQDSKWQATAYALNEARPPCDNCRDIFGRLEGFISNRSTFWGACAEYCPVDSLLPDDPVTLPEQDLIRSKEQSHKEQCTQLFRSYRDIANKCKKAYKRYEGPRRSQTDYDKICHLMHSCYENIQPTLDIFGFQPHCRL